MPEITILHGDNIELLKGYPDNFFDSICTDCPYGLNGEPNAIKLLQDWINHGYHEVKGKGFMGKKWDAFVPQPILWKEAYRVLKPGGHLLAFFGTRTYDWGTMAIRLAGFEIRDMICWLYGQGFPKSLNINKQLSKTGEAEERFEGYGTALKPSNEPICVARKPLAGTQAKNILEYGTGAINIDACRIEFTNEEDLKSATYGTGTNIMGGNYVGSKLKDGRKNVEANAMGRFPSNVILDPFTSAMLDEQSGELTSGMPAGIKAGDNNNVFGQYAGGIEVTGYGDTGGASRFFYCAKASQEERNAGCDHLEKKTSTINNESGRMFNPKCIHTGVRIETCSCGNCEFDKNDNPQNPNNHPTVKPISLIRWLIRLVTPRGGDKP